MKFLEPYLTYIKMAAIAAAIVFAAWFGRHYTVMQYEEDIAEQNRQIADLKTHQAEETVKVVTKYVDRVRVVRNQSQKIASEVSTNVPPTADALCVIPAGFVRVHNEAATGVPDATGNLDEATSGVALSTVASTVADNYGTCHETAEQLKALQDWIRSTHPQ